MSKDKVTYQSLITLSKTEASAITNALIEGSLITDALVKSSPIGIEDAPPPFPPVIEDGNTVGWYIADDLTTVTKDGSDFVSVWEDKLASGRDLLQAVGTNQPLWVLDDGILFDGIDNFMKTLPFTFNQPEMIYMVIQNKTWAHGLVLFDGNATNTGNIYLISFSPQIQASSGGVFSDGNINLTLNTFHIVRLLFNGSSSKLQIDETSATLISFGSVNMEGFTLGAFGGGSARWSNIQVKEVILRKVADTTQDEQDIYDYLANKYSI